MTYLYYCPVCDHSFQRRKPISESEKEEPCPGCGVKALRQYTAIPSTFGWRLTEKSHEVGGPDCELERDI